MGLRFQERLFVGHRQKVNPATGALYIVALLLVLLGLGLRPSTAHSQDEEETLLVAVHHSPPYVIKEGESWSGFGIDLWRGIAEDLDLEYELVELDPSQQFGLIEEGEIDLALAAAISEDGERRVNYTHSYFVDDLGFARPRSTTVMETIETILSPRFLTTAFWVGVVLVLVGLAVWIFERRENADMFGDRWHLGAWSGFWWAAVTLTTIGYGDKVPQTFGGRVVALSWMLAALVLSATLTATITSVLAFGPTTRPLEFPEGLRQRQVAAVAESGPAAFLEEERIQFKPFDSVEEALEALNGDEIDLVVHHVASLRFVQSQVDSVLVETRSLDLLPQHTAFALQEGNEMREELNRALIKTLNEPGWRNIVSRYIDTSSQ